MDIKNEIKAYIDFPENNGALLITGEWGCGKTHLLRDVIEELNGEYAIAMISLFGLDDVEAINKKIAKAYLELETGTTLKDGQKITKCLKQLAGVVESFAQASPTLSIATAGLSSILSIDPLSWVTVENTIWEKPFVLVIDDLERSRIKKEILLGTINDYTENKNIKTIIIADEEKIKGKKYTDFKEKLISRTVKMTPDSRTILHAILSNLDGMDEYRGFLLEHEDCLYKAFSDSRYYNLRSFKSCIFDFKRVYDAWNSIDVTMSEIDKHLYSFCAMTYEFKHGTYQKDDLYGYGIHIESSDASESDKQREQIVNKYIDKTFSYTFTSLSQWIVDGVWEEERFKQEVSRRYSTNELPPEKKVIHQYFWSLTEEELKTGLPILYNQACNGDLSRYELIVLLQILHLVNTYCIDIPMEVNYEKIEKGFDIRIEKIKASEIKEPACNVFSQKQDIDSDALDLYKKIESVDDKIYAWDNRKKYIDFLEKNNDMAVYQFKYCYIDCFDDELLNSFIESFRLGTNSEKRDYTVILNGLDFCDNRFSSVDEVNKSIKNLIELKENLERIRSGESDQITRVVINESIATVDNKIVEMQKKIGMDTNA